jgi:hypothetical protein
VDDAQVYHTSSAHIDKYVSLGSGTHEVILKAWDTSGAIQRRYLTVKAGSASASSSYAVTGSGGVQVKVTSPANNASVGSQVHFVASAIASSSRYNVSSMQIYVDDQRVYRTSNSSIDKYVGVSGGSHSVDIKAWDTSGALQRAHLTIHSGSTSSSSSDSTVVSSGAKNWYKVEQMDGWQSCSSCAGVGGDGPVASYWSRRGVSSPSRDGNAREFFLGGGTPYSNVLFSKRLTGDAGFIRDQHNFVYDLYFYYTNSEAAQALEFDINQYIDGKSYIWGTQCNIRAGHTWDIWNNIDKRWVSTGAYCPTPATYSWNHVVLEMQRTSDRKLRYISITFNGSKHYLNRYYSPRSTSWTGLTLNYQMDGNVRQQDYHTWVDKFHFSSW